MIANALWVTASNLVANGVTFLLMAFSAKFLPVSEFASLSLAVSFSLFLVTILDFGINLTTVRSFSISQDVSFIDGAMTIKWLTFIISTLLGAALLTWGPNFMGYTNAIGWGLIGAAVLNLWLGCRTIEQARNAFKTYAYNNFFYAFSRFVAGCLALWLGLNGQYFYLAAFILPSFIFVMAHGVLSKSYRLSKQGFSMLISQGKSYSLWVFLSSAAYNGLLYLPQYFVAQRLSDVEVSSYGIVLSFLGIASLVAASVRTVFLPRLISDIEGNSGRILVQNLLKLLPIYTVSSLLIILAGSHALGFLYGQTMPEAGMLFVICGIGLLGTIYIGFFNMMIHALGRPKLEAIANFLRLITLITLLWLWGYTLYIIALIFSMTLLAGELAIAMLIGKRLGCEKCELQ